MELKEMIKVMQHYEDGGEIEVKGKNEEDTKWVPCKPPIWNWNRYTYRMKEPSQKVTIEKWLCRDCQGDFGFIEVSNIDKYGIYEKVKLIESYEIEL